MNSLLLAVLPLIILCLLLYGLSRALARLQLKVARFWYMFNAVLGTACHETSHALGCLITRTKILEFRPFSPQPDGTLGWVKHEQAGKLGTLIISVAPLFGNTAALAALAWFVFPQVIAGEVPQIQLVSSSAGLAHDLLSAFQAWSLATGDFLIAMGRRFAQGGYADWRTWTFFYLALSIGSHAAPSKPDLKHFLVALGPVMLVLGGVLYAYEHFVGALDGRITGVVQRGVDALTGVMTLGIAFSLVGLALSLALYLPLRLVGRAK